MELLSLNLLIFLLLIALFTGFLKTGLPVLGAFLSLSMALVFPPREAVGLTLLYLIVGDLAAVYMHWHKADLALLKRMLPAILVGIVLGSISLIFMNDQGLGFVIGCLFVLLVTVEQLRQRLMLFAEKKPMLVGNTSGVLAGITTAVGNIAGPVLSIYFLLLKIDKYRFVGTTAVFFMLVNLIKVPIYSYLDMFDSKYVLSFVMTAPFVFIGAIFGGRFLQWIPQKLFNRVILLFTGIGGVVLMIKYWPFA